MVLHRRISLNEVEIHNAVDDFWTVIENKVFDLSDFSHPGGVIINSLAGTDGTLLYHQYHFTRNGLPDRLLAQRQIGVLSSNSQPSPEVGKFYRDVSQRVANFLVSQRLEQRPIEGLLMLIFDFLTTISFMYIALFHLGPQSSLTALVSVAYFCDVSMARLRSQAHAVGHMHVVGKKWVWIVELLLTIFSDTSFAFALPSHEGYNLRKMLNRHRSFSQFEYKDRGPFEHQALHHIKGTDFSNDSCYQYATLNHSVRLRPGADKLSFWGIGAALQGFEIGRFVLVFCRVFLAPAVTAKMKMVNTKHLFQTGQHGRGIASAFGVVWIVITAWASVFLPLLYSKMTFTLVVATHYFVGHFWMLFFAQHTWDSSIPQADADADWGAAQAKGCYSLWGSNMAFHPMLWFYGHGTCPSTLTYHLEHTLFPGISYLHLPLIAPVVEQVCHDHGLPYNKINGLLDLRRKFSFHLIRYSRSW